METNFWEIALRHLQHIVGIGKKHITTVLIESHKLMFAFFECFQCVGIIAFNPTCLI